MPKLWLIPGAAILSGITLLFAPWRRFRIVYLSSLRESIWWTLRLLWFKQPLPLNYEDWDEDYNQPWDVWGPRFLRNLSTWVFLEPFFRDHGYILYRSRPGTPHIGLPVPGPTPPRHWTPPEDPYPFARKFYDSDDEPMFFGSSSRLWAARNLDGHDVVLKLVDGLRCPELQALQHLNSASVRSDKRNHVIYLLDVLKFDDFVFVVMPRWDAAFSSDFRTVGEVLDMCYTWLEAFAFIHENRVAHGDIMAQNAGLNTVCSLEKASSLSCALKIREVRYAIIDFGNAFVYPLDTVLEDVQETRFLGWTRRGFVHPKGAPYNPFKADVLFLGHAISRYVRHIEYLIPALGPFFDSMTTLDEARRPMAQKAFDDFKLIYHAVPPELLSKETVTRYWEDPDQNKIRCKDGSLVTLATLLAGS